MLFHFSSPKVLDVFCNHFVLYLVCRVLLCFRQVVIDQFQETRKLSILDPNFNSFFFNDLQLWLNCCNFNCILCLRLFCKSIILRLDSLSYQNFFDLFSISFSDIFGVISWSSVLVRKSYESERCLSVKD